MLTNLSTKIAKPNIKVIQSASKKHVLAQNMGSKDNTKRDSIRFIKIDGVEIF